jgi:AAA family ATP:ADP antiporter
MKALRNLFAIRPNEQRDVWTAFVTLFGVIGSLTVLETARDALFLSRIPATQLPWMYIALAVLSLLAAKLNARLSRFGGRVALSMTVAASAAVTISLAHFLRHVGHAGVYAIYIWSSLSTAMVIVRFWMLVSSRFTILQAKRLYGLIGAGSVVGAIAGSAVARTLAATTGPRHLVMLAGFGFAATALLPLLFTRDATQEVQDRGESIGALKGGAGYLARQPYALRLVLAMTISTACVTIGDYLFKSTAAAAIPRAELGAWFATVYLFLNVGSLFAQLVLAGWLTRRVSVPSVFMVLPALMLLGGLGMLVTAGIASALVIKGGDGVLRYSLHKTSSEMLYLPFTDAARQRVKAVIDVVGQRGGQAAASILVLAISAAGGSTRTTSIAIAVLALLWIASAVSLRPGYLGLFRGRLGRPRFEHLSAFPELDLASLETLLAALDSKHDGEVLAALDALEREGKVRLIPALILHHPAEAVVVRALRIFIRAHRASVVPVVDRLLDHASPRVRGAALTARSVFDRDAQPLLLRASVDESPEVRATITVNLIASGDIYGDDARDRLRAILRDGAVHTKVALAEAIAGHGATDFTEPLIALARDPAVEVRRAAAKAMAALHDPRYVSVAIDLLADENTRPLAKEILIPLGAPALQALVGALRDPARAPTSRWRLAQLVSSFEASSAARALSTLLTREDDGAVRFQIIRGLEGLVRRHPDIRLDAAVLDDAIDATVRRAYRYHARRAVLERGAAQDPMRKTPGGELLIRVLDDKACNATDRLFRLLGLAHPMEDFFQIYRGIVSGRRDAREGAMELVANVLREPLRSAVIGLVEDVSLEERLDAGGPYRSRVAARYEDLLDELLESTSESVRSVAVFHVGELRLTRFAHHIEAMLRDGASNGADGASDAARTLERLSGPPEEARP